MKPNSPDSVPAAPRSRPGSPTEAGNTLPPILVTGGGGFLGSYITRRLLARGEAVRILNRRDHPALAALGADCRRGGLADPGAVREAADGCRAVIHTAALAGIGQDRRPFHETNCLGTKNLLDAALALGIRKLVHTSSPAVVNAGLDIEGGDESLPYPDRYLSPYAETKAEAEKMVLSLNSPALATIALRPHLMFGPGDNQLVPGILARARAGKLRRVGGGGNRISVCYVEDAAEAHLLALDRLEPGSPVAGRAYFINYPEPVNCWDFINRLVTGSGLPEIRKSVPLPLACAAGWLAEVLHAALGRREDPPMTRFLARQLALSHWFRPDRARDELGWKPAVPLEEAIRRTLA
ncbi:MAG: NAD-dependent epimerase/dehydratase family protein [Planctomycetota bacterium]|nr:NAD-dependent epimerase/dehydratase family protein [Planctomycetota bacterium]